MTRRQQLALRAAVAALVVLATGVAFAAYLRPGMLIEFVDFLCS